MGVDGLIKLAHQGDTEAQFLLGIAYLKGDGVEKDPATCVKLSLWKADLRGKRMPTVNAWKAFPLLRVVDMRYAPVMICRLKVKVRLHTARDLILIPAHCFALP